LFLQVIDLLSKLLCLYSQCRESFLHFFGIHNS
jgi:hypothetical protein